MNPLDWFQTIGAGLAAILTFMIIYKNSSSFFKKLWTNCISSWKRWQSLRLFRKYCPYWEVVNKTPLKVMRVGDKFRLNFSMDIKYISRDSRYDTMMDCKSILIDIYNKGKDREKRPYRLCSDFTEGSWRLPKGGEHIINYNFDKDEVAVPLLNGETICQIISIGEARIAKLSFSKGLKLGKRFKVIVVWGKDSNEK